MTLKPFESSIMDCTLHEKDGRNMRISRRTEMETVIQRLNKTKIREINPFPGKGREGKGAKKRSRAPRGREQVSY